MKYVAELAHVREVSLLGSADFAFWAERLKGEGLMPVEHATQARVMLMACDSKFFGMRFRELSFSVFVHRPDTSDPSNAACLVQAFNSSRFFAWSERTWFSTPYDHGMIEVNVGLPASIGLVLAGQSVFRAEMAANSAAPTRVPARRGIEGWNGPIYLPSGKRDGTAAGRLFFAKIEGETETFPFAPTDSLTINPFSGSPILQALNDSHFVAREWQIRRDAKHAKSKTYRRMDPQVKTHLSKS